MSKKDQKEKRITTTLMVFKTTTTALLTLFVAGNIFFSQTISPLYSSFIEENKEAVVSYLIHIRPLPFFSQELIRYKNKYGQALENQVFYVEKRREEKTAELTALLQKNSLSRDLLYNLSVLYRASGDEKNADVYLQRAKDIDPNINN